MTCVRPSQESFLKDKTRIKNKIENGQSDSCRSPWLPKIISKKKISQRPELVTLCAKKKVVCLFVFTVPHKNNIWEAQIPEE